MKILIVDDLISICEILEKFLKIKKHQVSSKYDGQSALSELKRQRFDLVILDVFLPDIDGIDLIKLIKTIDPNITIVLMSGKSEIIKSINSIELGVFDFLTKPINFDYLDDCLKNIKKHLSQKKTDIKETILSSPKTKTIPLDKAILDYSNCYKLEKIGQIGVFSEKMLTLHTKLDKLHQFPEIPILITGKTGSGKEVLSRYVHFSTPQKDQSFIAINCSTINKSLFESELFGYEKSAFTGADKKGHKGLISAAKGGTLFLDEITEIPIEMQAKLLRVIQEREYYPVGSTKPIPVKTRIICATNKNIKRLIKLGLFRRDLYYRLNVCQIKIPPLKERKDEIIPLIFFFLQKISKNLKKEFKQIEIKALKVFEDYQWPGNIREMQNLITNLLLFVDDDTLREKHIASLKKKKTIPSKQSNFNISHFELPDTPFSLEDFTKNIVKETLKKFNGNKTKTAKFLGLSVIQLYRRYKT